MHLVSMPQLKPFILYIYIIRLYIIRLVFLLKIAIYNINYFNIEPNLFLPSEGPLNYA